MLKFQGSRVSSLAKKYVGSRCLVTGGGEEEKSRDSVTHSLAGSDVTLTPSADVISCRVFSLPRHRRPSTGGIMFPLLSLLGNLFIQKIITLSKRDDRGWFKRFWNNKFLLFLVR